MQKLPSLDQFHADHDKRASEFFGQFQKAATNTVKRGFIVWIGLAFLNLVMGLMALAGAVFIVLLLLRVFSVI